MGSSCPSVRLSVYLFVFQRVCSLQPSNQTRASLLSPLYQIKLKEKFSMTLEPRSFNFFLRLAHLCTPLF